MAKYKEIVPTDSQVREHIDETQPKVEINGLKYSPGRVLSMVDVPAFNLIRNGLVRFQCVECGRDYESECDASVCC